ncbi:MAG: hypothetical protein LUC45_05710, partial [Paraprevotella sp.]|nr:hypothetical protein [Paraprevotella sp.]
VMALCGATSSTLPLLAADWADPTLTFVDPNLNTDGTGGGVYYIYHVGTQEFMSNGNWKNNWDTECVVADEGQEVTVSYGEDYALSHRSPSAADYSTAKGWRLSMMNAPSNGGFHELFIREASLAICVDHNNTGHMLWQILPQGDQTYRIRVIDEDPTFGANTGNALYEDTYVAVNYDENTGKWDNGVNPVLKPTTSGYEKAGLDWKFVTPEVYNVYEAKKQLQAQLEAADEVGFTDYTEYANIYNNASATQEEVEKATSNLKSAILQYKYSSASASNPVSMTDMITNPSFDTNSDGWTIEKVAAPGQDNFSRQTSSQATSDGSVFQNFYERWNPAGTNNPDWSIMQDLTGLPDGAYSLKAYILTNNTDEPKGRFLVAKTLSGEVRTEANVSSPDGNGYAVPYEVKFSVVGGTASIGMRVIDANSNWSGVDNFTLTYYGTSGASTMRDALNESISSAESTYQEYQAANAAYSQAGDEKYQATIQAAKDAAANTQLDDDSLKAVIATVQARMDSLANDVKAYKTLNSKITELNDAYDASPYAESGLIDYEDYLDDLAASYNDKTFNPNDVDSIQTRSDRALVAAVKTALIDGTTDNVTGLLTNPNFTGSASGWSITDGASSVGYANNVGEVYNNTFDVYQELTGMPEGSYRITMQGFYRPDSNTNCSAAWGVEGDQTNDILAYVYGNDAMTKLHHVYDKVYDENLNDNCAQLSIPGSDLDGKYALNGRPSAETAFGDDPDAFLNTVTCYVTSDGKLRVGAKLPTKPANGNSSYWTVFDNFQVTYLGADDMTGAESALTALVSEATDLLNQADLTTVDAKNGLNTAISSANSALTSGLTRDIYNEQVTSLDNAISAGEEAISAVASLDSLVSMHDNRMNGIDPNGISYDKYADTEAYDEFDALIVELLPIFNGDKDVQSMDEIDDYVARINEAYSKMVAGAIQYAGATKDAPVDMTDLIQNPSFDFKDSDSKAQNWTITGNSEGSIVTSESNYEMYNMGGTELSQTLYSLPKGYYRITYNGFYRAGDTQVAALTRRDSVEHQNVEAFVETGSDHWNEPLPSIFSHVGEYKYDSSDKVMPDSLFPDMTNLLYHCVIDQPIGARLSFEDGNYEDSISFYVPEDGQPVKIGMRKENMITHDWTCFDNFHLYYLGDGDANRPDDFVSSVDGVDAKGTATVVKSVWYTINGMRVDEPKQSGIYIRQDVMSDGTRKAVKVVVK